MEAPQTPETKKEQVRAWCTQCKNYYGSKDFEGMCSACYKKKHPIPKNQPTIQKKQQPEEQDPQPDKSRCRACKKKVGLLGVKCKCQFIFCNIHRMPQNHECVVDYKKIAEEQLKKDNILVKNHKLQQI